MLTALRKSLAEKDGLPPYAVFTNEQLAAMVQGQVASLGGLEKIQGVGDSRMKKYGAAFLEVLKHARATKPTAPSEVAGPS